MKRWNSAAALWLILAGWLALCGAARAQFFTGPYGPGGTWNLYEVVTVTATWQNARDAAQAKAASATGVAGVAGNPLTGHLVQITSADENTFVAGAATLTPQAHNSNVWIGLNDVVTERGSSQTGWEWAGTAGPEVLDAGEFNAWTGNPTTANDAVEMSTSGLWNSNQHNSATVLRRYVIEWEVRAAGPIAGAEQFPIYYTGPYGPAGTYNLYRIVFVPTDFTTAHNAAVAARADSTGVSGVASGPAAGITGHLISIGSEAEQHFAYRLSIFAGLNSASVWIGATDSPTFGGNEAGTSKTNGWVWAGTSEPFTYQRFQTRPPTTGLEDPTGGLNENAVIFGGSNHWVDTASTATTRYRYLVEWNIGSATPIAGAAQFSPLLTGTRDLGQPVTSEEWVVRETRLSTPTLTALPWAIPNALRIANSTPANMVTSTGTRVNLNITDLSPGASNAGRSFNGTFGNHLDYIANEPLADDNNILCVAKTKLVLPAAGQYTVNVQCDDGFILRMAGATFTKVTGLAGIDPADPSCVFYNNVSNMRGVFSVPAAGEYDVEYIGWESTSGSLIQVSYAPGAHSWDWDAVWTLMGGTPPNPAVLPQPAGSLPAPVAPLDGSWGVRVLRTTNPGATSMAWALDQMTNNAGAATNHTAPVINFADFNSRATSGIFCGESDIPGSNTSARDTYLILTGRCRWDVPTPGVYTISVASTNEAALRIRGAQFSGRINGFTTGWVDHADKSTIYWQPNGATMRATVDIPAAGGYEVELIWYQADGGFSPHCEVAYAAGAIGNNLDAQEWKLMGKTSGLTPILPPGSLANAPLAENSNWGIHHVSGLGGTSLLDLSQALAALAGSTGTHTYGFSPVINHSDPQSPGSAGLFLADRTLPGNTASRDDNHALHAKAILDVATAGYYTIGVDASDGYAVRMPGNRWTIVTGTGGIDPASPDTFFWPTRGSDTTSTDRSARAVVYLPVGQHPIEAIAFDRLRGFYFEVFAAAGSQFGTLGMQATATANSAYKLIGHVPAGNLRTLGVQSPGWTVLTTPPVQTTAAPGNPAFTATLAGAETWITSPQAGFTPGTSTTTAVNFVDTGGATSSTFISTTQNFPLTDSALNDNWFVTRVTGNLVVPAAGTYNVGFTGGGSAWLEFLAPAAPLTTPQFSRLTADAMDVASIGASSAGVANARIAMDSQQTQIATAGEVTLEAGTYPVQALWYTGTSNAGFHLYSSSSNPQALATNLITTTSASSATGIVDTASPFNLVGELPDLRVTSVPLPPGPVLSGQQASFSWVVENVGLGATATGSWSDRVVLSLNTTLGDADDLVLGTFAHNGVLAPGGSYTATFSATLPDGISGDYYVFVKTDVGSAVNEGLQEGNNSTASATTFPVTLAPYPDLIVNSITAPEAAGTDIPFDVTWVVRNQGTAGVTGSWVDRVYLSADAQAGGDLLLGSFPHGAGLGLGGNLSRTESVTIPRASVTAGDYRIVVVTDATGSIFEHTNEGNNATLATLPTAVTITPLPDLMVETLIAPVSASSGQTITVQWTVRNAGGPANATSWFDQVFLSTDQTPDGSDAWRTEAAHTGALAANGTYTASLNLRVPDGASGTFHVIVVADNRNQVGEGNETNNALSRAIAIALTPPPDLQVTSVTAPASALSGQAMPVSWTVQNLGTGAVPADQATWSDAVYLSASATLDLGTAQPLGTFSRTGALAVDASYSRQNVSVTLPAALSGPRYLFVVSDSTNQVYEQGAESNNTGRTSAPVEITLTPPPDLIVSTLSGPPTGTAGQTVSLSWTVRNQGSITTSPGSWTDKVYLSTGTVDPQLATFLASFSNVNSLPGGATYSRTANVTLPGCIDGPFYLLVVTDANAQVAEFNPGFDAEANNAARTATSMEVVSIPPDLQALDVVAPAAGTAGQPITVQWTVLNAGEGATGATVWNDRVYLSTSPVFTPGAGQVLGTFTRNGALAASGTYTQSREVTLPTTAAGTYYLFVETDYANQVPECDEEENNVGQSTAFNVQAVPILPNPQNLSLTLNQSGQVLLQWSTVQPSSLVRHYAVYRSPTQFTSVTGLTPVTTTTSPSATLGSLASVADQFFAVVTVNVADGLNPAVTPIRATKTSQAITFPTIVPSGLTIPLVASASSGLPVRFEATPSQVATVSGNQLLVTQGGALTVTVRQDGDESYWPAAASQSLRLLPVIRSFTANGADLANGAVLTRDTALAVEARDADGIARAEFYRRAGGSGPWVPIAIDTTPGDGLGTTFAVDALTDGPYEVRVVVATPGGFTAERIHPVTLAVQPVLTLSFTGDALLEGAALTGQVSIQRARSSDLVVTVSSTRPTQLDPGSPVTIPAGQTTVPIFVSGIQDVVIEPVEDITVRVTAPGAAGGEKLIHLLDDDWPALTLTVDRTAISEASGPSAIRARVVRDLVTSEPLTVWLTNSGPAAVTVPAQVTIASGQAGADFLIGAVDDTLNDGAQSAAVRAEVRLGALGAIVQSNVVTVEVGDDEGPTLELVFDAGYVREGASRPLLVRRRQGPSDVPLTVALAGDDATELQVPPTVTIPAGQNEATATVTGLDDATADGSQSVLVTATAASYAPGQTTLVVTDETRPELTLSQLGAPARVDSETDFEITYRLENRGDATAGPAFTQRVFLSRDRVVGGDVLLRQYEFPGNFAAGATLVRRETVRAPREAGTYFLLVVTDIANVIPEVLETNNAVFLAQPIVVDAAYSATVAAGVEVAPANTPIPLTGTATRTGGAPAAFAVVNLHIRKGQTERVISALTNSTGTFSTSWTPLPGEGGEFEVGACHPGLTVAPTQDTFAILTAQTSFPSGTIGFDEGETATFTGTITNPTLRGLSGLTLQAIDAPAGWNVVVTLSGTTLAAGQTLTVGVQVAAALGSSTNRTVTLRLMTTEGVRIDVPVRVSVRPLVAKLVLEPGSLQSSVLRGTRKSVDFTIRNDGGLESGPVNVLLPALPWLSLASPSPLPTIPPGASVSVTLNLEPSIAEALTQHSGTLVLAPANGASRNLPFTFRIVSDQRGDLEIDVVDEYFYFTEAAPKLEGATVVLRDAISAEEIARVVTPASGVAAFPALVEGWYKLEVSAPQHTPWKGNYYVNAGETTRRRVFVSRELVTYTWTVEPIQIEDRYRITVETVFETNVPAPVVTVEPASLDVSDLSTLGQTKVVNMTIENHGFIAADHGAFQFSSHPFYEITPLVPVVGLLPAKSSLVVPVTIRRIGEFAEDGSIRTLGQPTPPTAAPPPNGRVPVPCTIGGGLLWDYICGPTNVQKQTPIAVSGVQGYCIVVGTTPIGGGGVPGGGGGEDGGGRPTTTTVTFSTPTLCDCFLFDELCLPGEKKIELEALGDALKLALASRLPRFIRIDEIDITLGTEGKVCICCVDGKYGLSGSGSASAIISGTAHIGYSYSGEIGLEVEDWANVRADISTLAGARAEITGTITIEVDKQCLEEGSICVSAILELKAFGGLELDGSASATFTDPITGVEVEFSGKARGALGVHGFAKATAKGCLDGTVTFEACASLLPEATLQLDLKATGFPDKKIGGKVEFEPWRAGECTGEEEEGPAPPPKFRSALLADAGPVFTVPGAEYLRSDAEVIAQEFPQLLRPDGVCAKVKVKLDQDAVMTRTAFRATLELGNKLTDSSLTGVGFTLDVRDANGQAAGDVFNVQVTKLEGLGAIDGSGQVGPSSTGSAQWTLIPRDTAAPLQDTIYTIGGTISYVQNGTRLNIPVEAVPITVKPDAALYLKYFHQRDVVSDDPHTDPIEPAVPYALAVLVENRGAGAANNLRITSAQPEIVDNEKGLLIDFKVIASEVAGQSLSPSLTANFGTIMPGGKKVATWLMTSSLQGLFTDYKATFEHLDGLNDPRISLIKEVEIHEMIRQIEALGALADGQPDFLVNDVADLDDRPDTVHLSDGSTAPVTLIQSASVGTVSAGNLTVTLNAVLGSGWAYLRVPDPGAGQFRLRQVVRSDGLAIPLDKNVWTTDRTFIGLGQRPTYENILHLVDRASTGQYTLTYEPKAADTTAPESAVGALSAASGVQIPVTWSGSDDRALAFFDVFVSVDGGAFTSWKTQTPSLGGIFTGESGRTYAFYSIGIDAAGNREAAPATPDASTTVSLGNGAPAVAAIADQTVDEGAVWTGQVAATDPDAPLTYEVLAGAPPGLVIDASGAMRWVTGENNGGASYSVTVRVTDNGVPRAATTQSFALNVVETNDAPTLAPPGAETATVGRPFLLTLAATDRDTPAQTLTYSLVGSVPAGMTVNPASGQVSWTPGATQVGLFTVTARATDNGLNPAALTADATFTIDVAEETGASNVSPSALGFTQVFVPANSPPSLVDLAAAFADAEDGAAALAYTVQGNSNPGLFNAVAINPTTRQLTLGFAPGAAGTAALTIRATDSGLLSTSAVLQVRVTDDPYEMWLFQYFPTSELLDGARQASQWGVNADPDFDLVPNIFEWALLRHPLVPDRSAPVISLDAERQVRLSFDRNALALDRVEFGLSASNDLESWSPLAAPLVLGTPGPDAGDGTQRQGVSMTDPRVLHRTRAEAAAASEAQVVDDAAAAGDQLGRAVAIDGATAALGVPNADVAGADAGAVLLVARDAGSGAWSFVREVRATDAAPGDNFGSAVSLDGDTLAVGAFNAGSSAGAVYVFQRDAGGAGQWGQVARIVAPDAAASDAFGFAVALRGDVLVAGAFGDDDLGSSAGSAYVFARHRGGTNQWGLVRKLTASDGAAGDTFGYAVAVDGEWAVVGSRWDDDRGSSSGSAYVFRRDAGGAEQWGEVQKLTALDGAGGDQFGHAVAIDGTTVLVGAPFHDAVQGDAGAAYVFSHSGATWAPSAKLAPSSLAASDRFGHAVAVRGGTAAVGARFGGAGAAYLFRQSASSGDWPLDFAVRPSDGVAGDEFGAAVSLGSDAALIGAPLHGPPMGAGAAYLYSSDPSTALRRFYRLDLQVR
jgi:subtilase family serine protease